MPLLLNGNEEAATEIEKRKENLLTGGSREYDVKKVVSTASVDAQKEWRRRRNLASKLLNKSNYNTKWYNSNAKFSKTNLKNFA